MRRAALLLSLAAAGANAQPAAGDLVINEIMFDPPAGHGSASNEWIELYNRSAGEIDLATLHLSEGTVRNYLSEAMRKVGAPNRTAAARLARERGWL